MRQSKKLRTLYKRANRLYFHNRLPDGVVIGWDSLGPTMGVMQYPVLMIAIDRSIRRYPSVAVMTLLHEMCHLSLIVKHGKRGKLAHHGPLFQREMLRLAKRGAFNGLW